MCIRDRNEGRSFAFKHKKAFVLKNQVEQASEGNEWRENLKNFQDQIAAFGLKIKLIKGDGNCLFRSISDQLEGIENNHQYYRQRIVEFIEQNEDYFAPFVENDGLFEDYVAEMKKDAVWGGNIEIQAFTMLYSMNAVVHIYNQPAYIFETKEPQKAIHLSYHQGDHYNSVRFADDINDNVPKELATYVESAVKAKEEMETKECNSSLILEDDKETWIKDKESGISEGKELEDTKENDNSENISNTNEPGKSETNIIPQEELKNGITLEESKATADKPKEDTEKLSINEAADYALMLLQDRIKHALREAIARVSKGEGVTTHVLFQQHR
eukprot:TRINITY_DN1946_c0_g2_i8.p1 TRINITY_DN1946_c0_g2~~TRINITY_DN1946_c0_g2_i8.p1  ORF type:complete len:329 (-),score=88.42 TRINITY_DN1946_c0_g2_i8:92-1078(-)